MPSSRTRAITRARGLRLTRFPWRKHGNRRRAYFRQLDVFGRRQAADCNRADNAPVFPTRHSPAPAREPRIAKVADVETFLRVAGGVADLLGGLALARGAVGFV